ncbi:aromatic-ring-hydroxylating dioxygenase subunit beta [Rhodococcus sp. DMU1]|uniref:aromatic-ring-hydroxylating dioxygenase subunit beta n=1 Tax=Rhodococcus sp. DMU1 TaxID=2722825 RepID=UPI00143E6FAB|nr:aromatic-ring-hydroxylating dioxygenase subunit beta [Rhodococcus sp. DMU1]QIX49836.1 aromatic-ring-hydroxylating dioxygenase subunit beta [Rhodococcus sp. DMU1]
MTVQSNERHDTSRYSYYLDSAYYDHLAELMGAWQEDWSEPDPRVRSEVENLLYREARLIDDGRFNDWVELFTDECLYWVPTTPGGGDPRREVSHAFDDRRRLMDRIYWLRTGLAFCQIPSSRTRRLVTNVEVLDTPDRRLVRSNFLITEFRAGTTKTYAGWCGHELVRRDEQWRIAVKQGNLVDCEHGHENLTLVL